jgi:hypothetical protein
VEHAPEPIADDELLYRRVPLPWYSRATGLLPEAFGPHKVHDATGLSVARARHKSVEDAARGRQGKQYYVASLQAGKLRENGIAVVPRPEPNDPGHSELPDLNAANRKDDRTLELQRLLVQLTIEVQGPFGPFIE